MVLEVELDTLDSLEVPKMGRFKDMLEASLELVGDILGLYSEDMDTMAIMQLSLVINLKSLL
jgi:hypothetical protein